MVLTLERKEKKSKKKIKAAQHVPIDIERVGLGLSAKTRAPKSFLQNHQNVNHTAENQCAKNCLHNIMYLQKFLLL